MISTVYNGSISRSNDRGETFQQVNFGTSATDPFYNALALMENAEDLNTKDSVFYSPDIAKSAGDTITYYSSTLNVPIKHVLTDTLHVYNTFDTVISLGDTDVYVTRDSTDTLILPDYVQSYFITQRGNGAYITRDMLRFSTNPEWWKLFEITGNDLHSHEISTDMNYAWSGSYFNGKITRVSGLANAYTQQAADVNFKPSTSDTLLLLSSLPSSTDELLLISPKINNSDTLLVIANIPNSSDSLIFIDDVPASTDTLIELANIPNSSDSLLEIANLPQSSDEVVLIDIVPNSAVDSLIEISSGDTITGLDIDAINLTTDYELYTFIDGSGIGDTIMGSDFLSSVDFASDEYFYLDGSPINVLVTGSNIDNIDFISSADQYSYLNSDPLIITVTGTAIESIDFTMDYTLYTFLDGSQIADTILGSDFYSINLYSDLYANIDGSSLDVIRTGSEISSIDFSSDYNLYNYTDGSTVGDTISGSDFGTINLYSDFYIYLDGTSVDAVVTGTSISQIDFENNYSLYKWHHSTQSSSLNGTALEYCIGTKTINLTGTVSDISIDPKNPDNVCIVIGGTGGNHVYYSSNATSSNPTFSAIDGDLPDMPVFGCVIEKDPATDVIIIGTEYGVFSTDNINGNNTSWIANNAEIGPIPIFDICQQWRDWEDGYDNGVRRVRNSGSIYACTFGRGIWRADNLLSIAEPYVINEANGINQLSLYPNPTQDNANISFTLNSSSDVSVQVFDLSGKVVKSIYNNYPFSRGTHNMNFSVEGLQLGTYLVLVKSNTEQKVVKFIKY
jgi:hypothetical protein